MKIKSFKAVFIFALITSIVGICVIGYVLNLKSGIEDNVLRLHIVGASDSEYDQNIKLCVRDRILSEFSDDFSQCTSYAQSETLFYSKKAEIENAANDELLKHGCNYGATANLDKCRFPTKDYNGVRLPSGRYTAVNIRLGNAEGHNWWCVMYPPLCITENTLSLSDESREKLKSALTDDEYALICQSARNDVKIKFKIAEILGKYFR